MNCVCKEDTYIKKSECTSVSIDSSVNWIENCYVIRLDSTSFSYQENCNVQNFNVKVAFWWLEDQRNFLKDYSLFNIT